MAQRLKCLLGMREAGVDPWVWKTRWRRKWQLTLVLLPGESHEGRSLVGYSPWGRKELDMTEWLHFHFLFSDYWLKCSLHLKSEQWKFSQSCPTLWDPMDCRLQGSSVHGIFQARVLEWVAISFSRGSPWPRNQTWDWHCRQTLYHLSHQGSPYLKSTFPETPKIMFALALEHYGSHKLTH